MAHRLLRTSPVFHIANLHTIYQLNHFYWTLTEIVSDPPQFNQQHRELNVVQTSARPEQYLTCVALTDGADQLSLLLRSHDLYIVAYRVNDYAAVVLRHRLPSIPQPFLRIGSFLVRFGGSPENYLSNPPFVFDSFDDVELSLGLFGITSVRINVGDSYPELEFAGRTRRMDLPINHTNLQRAFRGLVNSNTGTEIARSVLFFTQFISEPLRVNPIREHVIHNFHLRVRIPDHLLILEHGWGRASLCLHRQDLYGYWLEYGGVFTDDENEPSSFVSLQAMDRIYAITRRNPRRPNSSNRVNMWARYEYTLLEYERRMRGDIPWRR